MTNLNKLLLPFLLLISASTQAFQGPSIPTATTLAANPTDCAANQFANAIAANGNLTCAAIADADVPNNITVTLAATASALAANPSDCASNQFSNAIAANGDLTCAALGDADVPDAITISGGTVNNSVIGGVTPAAGTFTTINATSINFGQDALNQFDVGTFTPTVTQAGASTLPVYSTNSGSFMRIGNRVWVDIFMSGDGGNEGNGADGLVIGNLPFTVAAASPTVIKLFGNYRNLGTYASLAIEFIPNTTTGNLYKGSGSSVLSCTDQNNAARFIQISGWYDI